MIHVTKLDGASALIPTEAIKYVESIPDTLIYFLNGESLIIKETLDEFLERIRDSKKSGSKSTKAAEENHPQSNK